MKIDRTQDPYLVDIQQLVSWVHGYLRKMSQSKLAQALDVDASTVSRWKNGDVTRLYQEQLQAMAKFEGKPLEAMKQTLHVKVLPPPQKLQELEEDYVMIPLYSVVVGAGNGSVPGIERVTSILKFPKKWLMTVLPGRNVDMLEAVEVVGDSMPPLQSGSWVMCDRSDTKIRDGIFVIRVDSELWVKRLARLPGGKVRVSSDNPIYPPIEIL
ncbi:MAG: LexA family transcriptional regulator, partial [Chroococcidiopsis sp.]